MDYKTCDNGDWTLVGGFLEGELLGIKAVYMETSIGSRESSFRKTPIYITKVSIIDSHFSVL